jgi:integrase
MKRIDLPEAYTKLCGSEAMTTLALRFLILTAARASEVTGMTWDEVDFQEKIWTVPASRTKAGREHRVPLSSEAAAILTARSEAKTGALVFPGARSGRPMAVLSLSKVLAAAGYRSVTVHDFRNTFRDWVSERTDTQQARLMQAWSSFVTTPHEAAEVVPLHRVA